MNWKRKQGDRLLPEREAAPQSWHRSNGKTSFLSSHSSFSTRAEGNIPSVPRFLHGKVRTEGGDFTHGCVAERSEVILHMLQGLTVQSLGAEVK